MTDKAPERITAERLRERLVMSKFLTLDDLNKERESQRARAADRIEELEDKLARAMRVVELLCDADWDERVREAIDLGCDILSECETVPETVPRSGSHR